jgi:hypothetical protein
MCFPSKKKAKPERAVFCAARILIIRIGSRQAGILLQRTRVDEAVILTRGYLFDRPGLLIFCSLASPVFFLNDFCLAGSAVAGALLSCRNGRVALVRNGATSRRHGESKGPPRLNGTQSSRRRTPLAVLWKKIITIFKFIILNHKYYNKIFTNIYSHKLQII